MADIVSLCTCSGNELSCYNLPLLCIALHGAFGKCTSHHDGYYLRTFRGLVVSGSEVASYGVLRYFTYIVGSDGGRVVKLLACGARGPGFDSPPRHLNFRDW